MKYVGAYYMRIKFYVVDWMNMINAGIQSKGPGV